MIVYFLAFFTSFLLFYAIARGKKTKLIDRELVKLPKKRGVFYRVELATFFASLPPMFISAVRYYVGTDYWETYYTGFYRIMDGSIIDGFEPGFYLLNKGIQLFTENVFWLFIITSILFVGLVYKSIEDLSIDIPLSIILFFVTRYYFIGMNGVRQFIGLAILLYSIRYIYEKNPVKFGISIVIACAFHYTCILFIPAYFISRIKLNRRRILIFLVGNLIVFTAGVPMILRAIAGTKYGVLASNFDIAGIKFTVFTIALNFLLFCIGYTGYEKRKNDLKYCICLNIQFIALLTSIALQAIPLMERIYWIYSFPIIITLPYLLKGICKDGTRKIVKWGIVLIFLIYMIYDIYILGDHDVLPYQWIFGKSAIHYSGWDWYGGKIRLR